MREKVVTKVVISPDVYLFHLLRNPDVSWWCILRCWDDSFMPFYFPLRLFYVYEKELCMILDYWRCSTLNLVFICWFIIKYCMWGLRVLQVGIRAWLVQSEPKLCFYSVVCDMYRSNVDTCSVLLGGSEQSGEEARCFKCSGTGQVDVSLGECHVIFRRSSYLISIDSLFYFTTELFIFLKKVEKSSNYHLKKI
jgi:hypothetical protein